MHKTTTTLLTALALAGMAHARVITIQNITDYSTTSTPSGNVAISGDSDVSTKGTLVEAVSFGSISNATTIVNGVEFKHIASTGTNIPPESIHFRITGNNQTPVNFASTSAPYANLSAEYRAILDESSIRDNLYKNYLFVDDLLPDKTYELQIWFSNPTYSGTYANSLIELREHGDNAVNFRYLEDGVYGTTNLIKISQNNTGSTGGTGSYLIGTFTSTDDRDLSIQLDPASFITAIQLREINPSIPFAMNTNHPFLLVTDDQYPDWHSRKNTWPWSEIGWGGWNRTLTTGFQDTYAQRLDDAALACILETDGNPTRQQCIDSILYTISTFWTNDLPLLGTDLWADHVPQGNSILNMILALDVIHDDLTADQLATAESQVQDMVDWYTTCLEHHIQVRNGLALTWALYRGDAADFAYWSSLYLQIFKALPDGTWDESPGYYHARYTGGGRNAKSRPLDILAFSGHMPIYTDPQLQGFIRYGCSFAYTPFGAYQLYGDTGHPYKGDFSDGTMFLFYGRYGNELGRKGKWMLKTSTEPPSPATKSPAS